MAKSIQKHTEHVLRDLHARESMRLGWYRQFESRDQYLKHLRERKAQHQAFLMDLLRHRGLGPAWYAVLFYWAGNVFGWCTALLPLRLATRIERLLEEWILIRYERYLRQLRLHFNLRSMIEAMQLQKMGHNEPAPEVIRTLEDFLQDQHQLAAQLPART